jgi:multidrug efflux pump subunit AcrB
MQHRILNDCSPSRLLWTVFAWVSIERRNDMHRIRRLALLLAPVCLLAGGFAGYLLRMHRPDTTVERKNDGDPAAAGQKVPEPAPGARADQQLCTVAIVTRCPGMSAETMEHAVTIPLENSVSQAEGLRRIDSKTGNGISVVQVHFQDTPPAASLAQAAGLMGIVVPQLPSGTPPPKLHIVGPANVLPACLLMFNSRELTLGELAGLARKRIMPQLATLTDVAAAEIVGERERVLRVRLNPDRLRAYALSPSDVIEAIVKGNQVYPSGNVIIGDKSLAASKALSFEDLRKSPIGLGAATVYLRDVGDVGDNSQGPTCLVRVNGRRQVLVAVRGKRGAAAGATREAVDKVLGKLIRQLPDGAPLKMLSFGSGDTNEAGLITIHLRAAPGKQMAACEKLVMEVEDFLEKQIPAPNREWLLAELGSDEGASLLWSGRTEAHHATLRLQLAPSQAAKTKEHVNKLRRAFRNAFPAVHASFHAGAGAAWPVTVQVGGGTPRQQDKLCSQIRDLLAKLSEAADVTAAESIPSLRVEVDREKAAYSGVTMADVARSLVVATSSSRVLPILWRDPSSGIGYRVEVEIPYSQLNTDQPANVPIKPGKGESLLLRDVAVLQRADGPALIERSNLARVAAIRVNGSDMAGPALARAIEKMLQDVPVTEGMWVKVMATP